MRDQGAQKGEKAQIVGWPRLLARPGQGSSWIVAALLSLAATTYPSHASDPAKFSGPAQAQLQVAPVLVVVPLVQVRSSGQVPFYIIAGPPQALPANSVIRIRGLHDGVTPSEGRRGAAGSWDVPLSATLGLKLNVPEGLSGRFEFVVTLVGGDGTLLAERPSTLAIETTVAGTSSETEKASKKVPPAEIHRAEEAKQAENAKKAGEIRLAAVAKKIEEARLEAERVEAAWKVEEARRAAEARKAEEDRLAAEKEAVRKAEEALKAERARVAAEAKRIEEARLAAEQAEAARKAEEARRAEEARVAAEAKRIEGARLTAAAQENRSIDSGAEVKRDREGAIASAIPSQSQTEPDQQGQVERLLVHGERYLAQGNIAVARQYFLRAAEARNAKGALRLAETYDSRELARLGVHGVSPDPALAQRWYERALELGAPEAPARLRRLAGQ